MEEEFVALIANSTWDLVPHPVGSNVITDKWIFKHKFNFDGSLDRYKACWIPHGFTQRPGVDYDETFSLVVKPTTVHTVLSLVGSLARCEECIPARHPLGDCLPQPAYWIC
jgi:hypothetical protein